MVETESPGYGAGRVRRLERRIVFTFGSRTKQFFYNGVGTEIRLEEVVWGRVAKDGIPDLQNPPVLPANEAWYMTPTDRIFGVSFGGEHRAYPLGILNVHEMANDVVGGVPFALAY